MLKLLDVILLMFSKKSLVKYIFTELGHADLTAKLDSGKLEALSFSELERFMQILRESSLDSLGSLQRSVFVTSAILDPAKLLDKHAGLRAEMDRLSDTQARELIMHIKVLSPIR